MTESTPTTTNAQDFANVLGHMADLWEQQHDNSAGLVLALRDVSALYQYRADGLGLDGPVLIGADLTGDDADELADALDRLTRWAEDTRGPDPAWSVVLARLALPVALELKRRGVEEGAENGTLH